MGRVAGRGLVAAAAAEAAAGEAAGMGLWPGAGPRTVHVQPRVVGVHSRRPAGRSDHAPVRAAGARVDHGGGGHGGRGLYPVHPGRRPDRAALYPGGLEYRYGGVCRHLVLVVPDRHSRCGSPVQPHRGGPYLAPIGRSLCCRSRRPPFQEAGLAAQRGDGGTGVLCGFRSLAADKLCDRAQL